MVYLSKKAEEIARKIKKEYNLSISNVLENAVYIKTKFGEIKIKEGI